MEKKTRWDVREATEWEEILKAQRGSDLSGAKFCRERGINYKQFLYVRSKIHKSSGRSLSVAQSSGIARSRSFIPISVVGVGNVRLRFSDGLELTVDELPPAAWVIEVARSLVGEGDRPC